MPLRLVLVPGVTIQPGNVRPMPNADSPAPWTERFAADWTSPRSGGGRCDPGSRSINRKEHRVNLALNAGLRAIVLDLIKKLLIANRGEIAVRIIRAAQEMGVRTVAVYSDADRDAAHVAFADETIHLGASEPSASYLDPEKILAAAKQSGADAVHPGYGFLSERAEFAEACAEAGLIFVGPPGSAMRKLGAKIDAKTLAVAAGVPITPGYFEPGASDSTLALEAAKIGFPVMLKASAGGGGRGMRIVRRAEDIASELAMARDEALKGFGDDAMMVEKLVERPRHIEVQVLADGHGKVAALFERECSIQRRHQKLIEESPSPYVLANPALWNRLREASVSLCQRAGYQNAGTVEFMVDEATGEFYFLEVNARLQVEHPVTEAVTGVDLVKWQLRVASGLPLDLPSGMMDGKRTATNGHAIEVRIVAEDPAKGFLPSAGKILAWAEPKAPGIRVDTGYGPGAAIPRHYDSLLAKVIAHGEDREDALAKLRSSLVDFHILGVPTNIEYLLEVLSHPDFLAGKFDTGFLGREFEGWTPSSDVPAELGSIMASASAAAAPIGQVEAAAGVWDLADGFRVARP